MPIRPANRHSRRKGRRSAAIESPMRAHAAEAGVADRNRRARVVPRRRRRTVRGLEDSASVHLSVRNGDTAAGRPLRLTRTLAVFLAVVLAVLHATAEFQVGEETLRLDATGVATIAAPGGELLDRLIKTAAGGIDPGQAFAGLEGRDVGQSAVLVALQPHAAAAAHLRHLVERKTHHLAVLANRGHELALDRRDGARFVGRLDECLGNTRKGKQVLNVKPPDEARASARVEGELVAAVGENRKMVCFALDQVPEMGRGRGVRLQRYKDGGLSDITTFKAGDGLTWIDSAGRSFNQSIKELAAWRGNRGDAGRVKPERFLTNLKFGRRVENGKDIGKDNGKDES